MQHELYGFGGWLIIFVFGLSVLTPLIEIVSVYSLLYGAEGDLLRPDITSWPGFTFALWGLVVFECALFGYTGFRLIKDYRPSTIKFTRTTIWISSLVLPSAGIFLTGLFVDYPILETYALTFSAAPFELVQPVIWATIWTLYFAKSERVRVTYLGAGGEVELDEVFR